MHRYGYAAGAHARSALKKIAAYSLIVIAGGGYFVANEASAQSYETTTSSLAGQHGGITLACNGKGGSTPGIEPLPDANAGDSSASIAGDLCGNPVVVATGNKVEFENDFESASGDELGLHRIYNHYSTDAGIFGLHWKTNFDYVIAHSDFEPGACTTDSFGIVSCDKKRARLMIAIRPDGRQLEYRRDASGIFRSVDTQSNTYMQWDAQDQLVYHAENLQTEVYGRAGAFGYSSYISLRQNQYGVRWTYEGVLHFLTKVTHSSGRYVEFMRDANMDLVSVRDPQGKYHGYGYTTIGVSRILQSHTQADTGVSVAYHYENPSFLYALTGKSYNGLRFSTFGYTADGRVASTEHAGGVNKFTFAYSYASGGRFITTVTNPLGKVESYTHVNGRRTSVVSSATTHTPATTTSTTYDSNNHVDKETDARGLVTDNDYDVKGRLTRKIEALGTPIARTTNYVWHPTIDRIESATVVGVAKTEYQYGTDNRLSLQRVTNQSATGVANQAHVTTYTNTYHPNGLLKTAVIDGPLLGSDDFVKRTYSTLGDLVSVENSLAHKVTYSGHNGLGLPGRVTEANGAVTDLIYDAVGRIYTRKEARGGVWYDTNYRYTSAGRIASVTTPDGVTLTNQYTGALRLSRSYSDVPGVLSDGATREERLYGYDAAGNVTAVTDQAGTVIKRKAFTDYDELNRVRAVRGNDGQNLRYTYDLNGNLATITDSLNRVTRPEYDALNRVFKSTDAKLGVTEFKYDADDQLIWVKDPRGLITTYAYDGFGQLWSQTSRDTGTTSFQYNAYGQRTTMTRHDGAALTYVYGDPLGRLTSMGDGAESRTFVYDTCSNGKGRLCGAWTGQASTIFGYTQQGEVAMKRDIASPGGAEDWTNYNYDGMGRLTGISYPSGVAVGYGYAQGKLTTMTATLGGSTVNIATALQYQPFGPVARWVYGNGLARNYNYDLDGRLTGLSATAGANVQQSLTYAYNANDLIEALTNGTDAANSHAYGYDELGRLTSDVLGGGVTSVSDGFDALGNRKTRTRVDAGVPGVTTTYTIESTSNRMLAMNGGADRTFMYNVNGNLGATSGWQGNRTYAYDAFNRLESVTVDGVVSSYTVNALDQRVAKTNAGGTKRYVYDGQNQLLAQTTPTGWKSYLWLGSELVGVVQPDNTLSYVHTDHLGRPEVATNAARTAVWKAVNVSYNRSVTLDNIGGIVVGFPGQIWDEDTATWYNGFRDYEPYTGRYIQSDPIGLDGGLNTYVYVGGNPVNYIDALGLQDSTDHLWRPATHNCSFMIDCLEAMSLGTRECQKAFFPIIRRAAGPLVCNTIAVFTCEAKVGDYCNGKSAPPTEGPIQSDDVSSPPEPDHYGTVGEIEIIRDNEGRGDRSGPRGGGGGFSGGGTMLIGTVTVSDPETVEE